ncbi:D-alanyl-D-alanine carboxypeptidase family protein [Pseudomonadota bacterium]
METYKNRIQAIHKQLGIPPSYAQQYGLALQEEALELIEIGHDTANRPRQLTPQAFKHWQAMKASAEQDGIILQIVSAYRSVERQCEIIRYKLDNGQSIDEILHVSAAPGYSEHHTGRALDLTTPNYAPLEEEFENSDAFKWLCDHAAQFSFSLSYSRSTESKISYEPWHWAYNG